MVRPGRPSYESSRPHRQPLWTSVVVTGSFRVTSWARRPGHRVWMTWTRIRVAAVARGLGALEPGPRVNNLNFVDFKLSAGLSAYDSKHPSLSLPVSHRRPRTVKLPANRSELLLEQHANPSSGEAVELQRSQRRRRRRRRRRRKFKPAM